MARDLDKASKAGGPRYSIVMRNNETGEVRTIPMGDIPWRDGSVFWWTDGNFGCDCNRSDVWFGRGVDGLAETPCGATRFFVFKAILETGEEVEINDFTPEEERMQTEAERIYGQASTRVVLE